EDAAQLRQRREMLGLQRERALQGRNRILVIVLLRRNGGATMPGFREIGSDLRQLLHNVPGGVEVMGLDGVVHALQQEIGARAARMRPPRMELAFDAAGAALVGRLCELVQQLLIRIGRLRHRTLRASLVLLVSPPRRLLALAAWRSPRTLALALTRPLA